MFFLWNASDDTSASLLNDWGFIRLFFFDICIGLQAHIRGCMILVPQETTLATGAPRIFFMPLSLVKQQPLGLQSALVSFPTIPVAR